MFTNDVRYISCNALAKMQSLVFQNHSYNLQKWNYIHLAWCALRCLLLCIPSSRRDYLKWWLCLQIDQIHVSSEDCINARPLTALWRKLPNASHYMILGVSIMPRVCWQLAVNNNVVWLAVPFPSHCPYLVSKHGFQKPTFYEWCLTQNAT